MSRCPPLLVVSVVSSLIAGEDSPPVRAERVLGYIDRIPPEPAKEREARHAKVRARRRGTPILVHRGATRFAPENTLEAYAAAMDHGADGVEIDIRRSADGVLYVFHDDMLDRMTRCAGEVRERTYFDLLECGVKGAEGSGEKTARVPTLASVLVLARRRAMLLHLDIKEPGLDEEIEKLIDAAGLWDHLVAINDYNSEKLRARPEVKLLRYKGWFPQGKDADKASEERFLAREGDMVFVKDDPSSAVRTLGRKKPEARAVPEGLRAWWTPEGPCGEARNEEVRRNDERSFR